MNSRLHNAVGLCQKAGACKSGTDAAEREIRAKRAKLVLVEQGASAATRKGFADLCAYYGIECREIETVGAAIGKPARVVLTVQDDNFANMIRKALSEEEKITGDTE
ncbi:MAG: 50S ribosomal protein L7ae [Clostridiales bacterium]|nr:50S ribosomal protein L7ae [Clostridiales bacterium]